MTARRARKPFGLDYEAQRRESQRREAEAQSRRAPHHGGEPAKSVTAKRGKRTRTTPAQAAPDGETFAVEAVPGNPAILRVVGVAPDTYATLEMIGAMLAQLEEPSDEDPDRDAWRAFAETRR